MRGGNVGATNSGAFVFFYKRQDIMIVFISCEFNQFLPNSFSDCFSAILNYFTNFYVQNIGSFPARYRY